MEMAAPPPWLCFPSVWSEDNSIGSLSQITLSPSSEMGGGVSQRTSGILEA